jgi:hypothetical protein
LTFVSIDAALRMTVPNSGATEMQPDSGGALSANIGMYGPPQNCKRELSIYEE